MGFFSCLNSKDSKEKKEVPQPQPPQSQFTNIPTPYYSPTPAPTYSTPAPLARSPSAGGTKMRTLAEELNGVPSKPALVQLPQRSIQRGGSVSSMDTFALAAHDARVAAAGGNTDMVDSYNFVRRQSGGAASVHSLGSVSVARSAHSAVSSVSVHTTRRAAIEDGVLNLRNQTRQRRHFTPQQMSQLLATMTPHGGRIQHLLLAGNRLHAGSLQLLLGWLKNAPNLLTLELAGCEVGDRVEQIVNVLQNACPKLTTFNLAHNNIDATSVRALVQGVSALPSIETLIVHHNPLTLRGVAALVGTNCMVRLDCRHTFSTPTIFGAQTVERQRAVRAFEGGLDELQSAVERAPRLSELKLQGNGLAQRHAENLKAAANRGGATRLANGGLQFADPIVATTPARAGLVTSVRQSSEEPGSSGLNSMPPLPSGSGAWDQQAEPVVTRYTALYDVLGVSTDAEESEIRRVYRATARELHPDKFRGVDAQQERNRQDRWHAISLAYRVLSDPDRRAKYDATGFMESPEDEESEDLGMSGMSSGMDTSALASPGYHTGPGHAAAMSTPHYYAEPPVPYPSPDPTPAPDHNAWDNAGQHVEVW